MTYLQIPIELNATALKESMYAAMQAAFPSWRPYPGNPEKWQIDAEVDRLIVPLAQMAANVPDEIFARFGEQIVELAPIVATPAFVTSTWTMKDTAGYTIKAGTQVDLARAGDQAQGFRVVSDVVIPPGTASTPSGGVSLEAIEPGVEGNGLSEGADVVNALLGEPTVVLVGESANGREAETSLEYLTRLTDTMKTLGPHPIIASDAEILARNVPGVWRAVALDNFDPATDDPEDPESWETEKFTTLALADAAGEPVSATIKEAVEAALEAKREANWILKVIDATYSTIKSNYEVVPRPGYSQAIADADTAAAIKAWVNQAFWGTTGGDLRTWELRNVLRYQDLVTLVNDVPSVDHYTVLKVAKGAAALGTADVVLTGPAALTKAGVIQVGK